jgi:crotonobetainyl-CoA:carnitine CoA-transferase CaiB-like acyl-CoA transferase
MRIERGGMPMVAAPLRFDGVRATAEGPPPRLDEHGDAIRNALARDAGWPAA